MEQECQENGFFDKHRDPTPVISKVVGCKITDNSIADVNSLCQMNLRSDTVFTQNPNFVNFGLATVNTTDKLGSISVPTTRVRRIKNGSNWIRHGNDIDEVTADKVS